MKRVTLLFALISLLILLAACKKETNTYLSVAIPKNISFIGHKGSGNENQHGNIGLQENTWEAIANAMNSIDGSEIDIQMSLDSTFWIFHSPTLQNCNGEVINIALLTDDEIAKINKCS